MWYLEVSAPFIQLKTKECVAITVRKVRVFYVTIQASQGSLF